MTPAQNAAIKAHILASPDLNSKPNNTDGASEIAALLNLPASPGYWVWRTAVSRQFIYNTQNDLPVSGSQTGFWVWATYKTQTLSEHDTWREIFMGDVANFAQANTRAGIAEIFSGSAATNAQQAHCLAVGRRLATRIEKVLATGSGTTGSPSVMGFEGDITYLEVDAARNS